MPAANEVESFLSQYTAAIVEEARKLTESRSVKLLQLGMEKIEAEVAMTDDFVNAVLSKAQGTWTGHADAEDETLSLIHI